jgi:tetratricopeptide (TPR) repeat protein
MTGKQALWSRGFTAFRSGQYAKAAEAYRQMTEADPNEPIAWMELGSALLKMGDSRAALENYRRALQLAPGNALVHQNLAICLTHMGSAREAVEHYRAAIRADPGMRQSYFHLANELMRLGSHQEAAELYAKAVAQEPGNEFARFMEAIALVRLGQYKEARTRLESAITALPGDADLAYALARILAAAPEPSVRDGRLALQTVQKLFAPGSSPDVEYVQTLAMALAENGRYAEALRIQDTLIDRASQAGRSDLLPVLEANRKQYQAGKPCRIPWPPDDPIFSPVPGPATPLTSGAPPASMR